ncbi:hypothetical protein [Arthrobacter psychrochitiniphilus]|uniref:Uncharacterized protein n=1 Tax=Arthrobacter psychrochitiniphilus TaxID=291045 RepID=A0A2V3DP65_9MICC|nr:hypothetical protein [Arthrobacter psychrochitiniphilus]NYG16064.1 hypothetical protein [Arthrobacter psychrochitiniphilus]PXA63994.1 hypothetical protein CVS29_17200 [Arthrobacter psychrochitiniphilus]
MISRHWALLHPFFYQLIVFHRNADTEEQQRDFPACRFSPYDLAQRRQRCPELHGVGREVEEQDVDTKEPGTNFGRCHKTARATPSALHMECGDTNTRYIAGYIKMARTKAANCTTLFVSHLFGGIIVGETKMNRRWLALGLAGVVLATTGCGAGTDTAGPAPSASTAQSASASTPPSPKPKEKSYSFNTTSDMSTKLVPGKIVQTSHREYLQVSIDPADPAYAFNLELAKPEVLEKFSPEYVTEAQKFLVDFFVTEIVDSPLNGAGETPDQWWARNSDKIAPKWADQFRATLGVVEDNGDSASAVVEQPSFREDGEVDIDYEYEGDQPRVVGMQLVPTAYKLSDDGDLAMGFDLRYKMNTVQGEKMGSLIENGTVAYSVSKTDDGAWVISGWSRHTNFNVYSIR